MLITATEAPAPSEPSTAPAVGKLAAPTKTSEIIPFPAPKAPIDPKSIVVPGRAKGGEEGKGGDETTAFTAFTLSNAAFLEAIFSDLPEAARPAVTSKPGDPQQGGWLPSDGSKVEEVCPADRNTYFNCASLCPTEAGSLVARRENAAAYHALVLDDVGTKVDRSLLGDIAPTWELETSPANFQIGFKLNVPIRDPAEVDRFQHRFSNAGLTDKGALGMVRWVRLPNGINGKAKYLVDGRPFQCRLHQWNPGATYAAEQLLEALAPASEQSRSASSPSSERRSSAPRGDGVYFPPNAENPVISAFKERGLYKREISPGRHDVTCPWLHDHTDEVDTGAAYFEPSEQYPTGGFRCLHSHGEELHIGKVLSQFALTDADARNKPRIRIVLGELNTIVASAERALAKRGDLYQSGGIIVTVKIDPVTGDATIKPVSEAELTLAMAAACDWEKFDGRKKEWSRCDPPERHVKMIFRAEEYAHLPQLRGFARQPFYQAGGTKLVAEAGYDPVSQRLGIFDPEKFVRPAPTPEAAREALELLMDLVGEFHFAEEVDRAATLSALLTAVIRPALDLAPAFHVTAPSPGSGKSYLCETIALFAGPGSSAKVSYPRTSEEATKVILSTLLAAPAVIEFDDMDTDWYPHGAINRMLTATSITDRLLGYSKMATVGTTALVLGSGNNVGPLKDLARRVLTINLNAKSESPATLAYKGNPVATLKAERERYVAAALTIIEAWKAAGSPKAGVSSIASYGGAWSNFCREPLIWLGLPDPATTLLEQVRQDPEADTVLQLLREWHAVLGDKPVTVRRLVDDHSGTELYDALMDLPVVEQGKINRSRLGRFLGRNRNRILGGLSLREGPNSERRTWMVVQVSAAEAPPSPPSPPSSGSASDNDQTAPQRKPEDAF